jgi:hypothetical protein
MKKIYLLTFTSIFSFLSFAQTFAPIGATWKIKRHAWMSSYLDSVVSDSDTLILGKTCRKIIGVGTYNCSSRKNIRFTHESNDSIYIYDRFTQGFRLSFPQNAIQGDEWMFVQHDRWAISDNSPSLRPDTIFYRIDSLEIIDVNVVNKKKFYTSRNFKFTIDTDPQSTPESYGWLQYIYIEDIGNLSGLFERPVDVFNIACEELEGSLICYTDSNIGTYINTSWGTCQHDVGIEENNQLKLSIYPNPFQDGFQIESSDLHQIDEIVIRDISGKEVKRINQNLSFISTEELVNGMYFLEARKNGIQVAVQKIRKL